jgi:cytochrome P450
MDNRHEISSCPIHQIRRIPNDGTPLNPSPVFSKWRTEGAATPLEYSDGHEGLIINRYEQARLILADKRFSQSPARMPAHHAETQILTPMDESFPEASNLNSGNILALDGEQHSKIRRTILKRFSVKSARSYEDEIKKIVSRQFEHFTTLPKPVDLTDNYSEAISTATHIYLLGIPDPYQTEYARLFVGPSVTAEKVDFMRRVLVDKKDNLGDDVLSDLIQSDLDLGEIEGISLSLMVSGRDSVAYMISTIITALLQNPEQLRKLRENPEVINNALEEFMRLGSMFLTLFPRTAIEDVEIGGVSIAKGQSVSVSPVAANYDDRQYVKPHEFDISRDAFGHLGFGHGIHGCIGQQVARVEMREGVLQLVQGLPNLQLVHADQLKPRPFAHPVATYSAGKVFVTW